MSLALPDLFRALRSRNLRLFLSGQVISVTGSWMQNVAVSWLVFRLTGSALWLGVLGFIAQIPLFLFSPWGGALADRFNRRNLIITTQTLAMVQASVVAVLTLTGYVEVWHLVLLSAFLGMINVVDIPARHSFVPQLVSSREDLGNAIALNSSVFNAGRLIGPAVAGILIAATGEGVCFLINALSYVAVIFALRALDVPAQKIEKSKRSVFADMREGFRYVAGSPPIFWMLLMLALTSLVGMPYIVIMPVVASDTLHGGSHLFGFLVTSSGIGALCGAILLASRRSVRGLECVVACAMGLFGAALVAFSLSRTIALSLVFALLIGFCMIMQTASINTLLQTLSDDDKRGRVMSFYSMAYVGIAPFGSLLAGTLADSIGAPMTLRLGGIICFLGSILLATRIPVLRSHINRSGATIQEELPMVPDGDV